MEEYKKELSIKGTVKEISDVLFTVDGRVRTNLRINSGNKEIKEFLEEIASLEDPFKYDPAYASIFYQGKVGKDEIELAFLGMVHDDIIGQEIEYGLILQNLYRDNIHPSKVLVQQSLNVSFTGKNRLYSSEFWKDGS